MKIGGGGGRNLLSGFFVGLVFLVIFLFGVKPASAGATIYFSPISPKVNAGDVFEVGVYVKSTEQAMNACETEISFQTDKLEVLSVSSKGSIFNLMVQNPSFSNQSGKINFSGVVLNPGFMGAAGKLLTLSLRAKTSGSAKLDFNSAQVLANDGIGTDILAVASSALVSIGQKKPELPPEETLPENTKTGTNSTQGSKNLITNTNNQPTTSTSATTTGTETTSGDVQKTEATATSAVVLVTSPDCTYDQLPAFFLKIGSVNIGFSGLLILLILICIAVAIYALYKARHLEQEHHKNLHKLLRRKE